MVFITEERITEIKSKVQRDDNLSFELFKKANEALNQKPLSVTFHKSPAESGNPHDYFSEGPYWWPDPGNPDGPYIKRDGEINPNRFSYHVDDLKLLCDTVSILAQAGLYLDKKKYFDKAAELLKVWFLNEDTKMNPHLEYGQAIRGISAGRGIGIIETTPLIQIVNAADILERDGGYDDVLSALKKWFSEYINWLNTSEKGQEEKNFYNNHSNWWNTQVATYCAFVGNEELLCECYDKFKNDILVNQTESEGRFTDELTRTRSYHYTIYNLTACTIICELAYYRGVDLWNYETPDGKSVKKCVDFFKPYYKNMFEWPHQEINASGNWFEKLPMRLAAMRFGDSEIEKTNEMRRKNIIPCSQMCHFGILDLV